MFWYIASNTHKVMTTFIFAMFVLVWSDWDNGYLQSISVKLCLQSCRDVWHFLWSCISYSVHCFVKVFCSDTMIIVIHCAQYRQLGYCLTLAYTHCWELTKSLGILQWSVTSMHVDGHFPVDFWFLVDFSVLLVPQLCVIVSWCLVWYHLIVRSSHHSTQVDSDCKCGETYGVK